MLLKNIGQDTSWNNNLHELVTNHILNDTEPSRGDELYSVYNSHPKFKRLFKAYLNLSENTRNKVKSFINLSIKDICISETCICKEQIPDSEFKVVKELFEYLYDDILSPLLKEHYAELKQEICPFCTLKNLELSDNESLEVFRREAYDHFLPISGYPWYGVKPDNLSPSCNICNSSIKRNQDPLTISGTRNNILFPYQRLAKFKIDISDIDITNPPKESIIDFSIRAKPQEFQESLDNLVLLFDLSNRFRTYLKNKARILDGELIKELRQLYKNNQIHSVSDINTIIDTKIKHLNNLKFEHNSIFLKIAFYKYKQTKTEYIFERVKLAS